MRARDSLGHGKNDAEDKNQGKQHWGRGVAVGKGKTALNEIILKPE